jgi:hypothetical protein
MVIDAATAAVLAAGVSGLCSAITAIGVVAFTKRSDERRHLREIVIKTAIENWKVVNQAALEARAERLPLDVYLVHMLKFSELLTKKHLTRDDIVKNEQESNILIDEAIAVARRVTFGPPNETTGADNQPNPN